MKPPTLCEDTPVGPLYLYPEDTIGKELAAGRFWEGELLLPLFDEVKPGEVVVNVGAYIGHEAIYLAEQRKAAVLAVEANFPVLKVMIANLQLHGGALAVLPICYAAYDRSAWFVLAPDQVDARRTEEGELDLAAPGSVGSLGFVPVSGPPTTLRGGPLDPFIFGNVTPGQRVSLIECDAQGCDLRALKGLYETIMRWRPTIVFEYEPSLAGLHGDDWAAHELFLHAINYKFEADKTYHNNFICRPK